MDNRNGNQRRRTSKDQRVFKRPARDGAEPEEDEGWRRNLSFEA
jgi:hypothetical protein